MATENVPSHVLVAIDAPDPDNFALAIALARMYPEAKMWVMLTGRPVRFNATKEHQTWQWDVESSRMAQEASAARLRNFLRFYGIRIPEVFDGGIAPRTLVPHWIHFAEYYKFLDVDPLAALRHTELVAQDELLAEILAAPERSVLVAVGGPMTGLAQLMIRNPLVASRFGARCSCERPKTLPTASPPACSSLTAPRPTCAACAPWFARNVRPQG